MQSLCAGFRTTSHGPVAASAADYCLPNRESCRETFVAIDWVYTYTVYSYKQIESVSADSSRFCSV